MLSVSGGFDPPSLPVQGLYPWTLPEALSLDPVICLRYGGRHERVRLYYVDLGQYRTEMGDRLYSVDIDANSAWPSMAGRGSR